MDRKTIALGTIQRHVPQKRAVIVITDDRFAVIASLDFPNARRAPDFPGNVLCPLLHCCDRNFLFFYDMKKSCQKMSYTLLPSSIDVTAPLIYMWEIRDDCGKLVGRYIGKAVGGDRRPRRHYARNVDKLLAGLPYRPGKNYRRVHHGLADAVNAGHRITLSYLCNVNEEGKIFEMEARLIREYGCDTDDGIGLNGRWKGNSRPAPAAEATCEVNTEEVLEVALDLEEFVEIVETSFPHLHVSDIKRGYSVWTDPTKKHRLVRAWQKSRNSKIKIKQAQTTLFSRSETEVDWNGTIEQLVELIKTELQVFTDRSNDGTSR